MYFIIKTNLFYYLDLAYHQQIFLSYSTFNNSFDINVLTSNKPG